MNKEINEIVCPECGGVATDQPTIIENCRVVICLGYFPSTHTIKKNARKTPCKQEFPYRIN